MHQEETSEASDPRLSTDCTLTAHRQDIQYMNGMRINEEASRRNNDAFYYDLTQQYKESYYNGVIPNDMRRKFGNTEDGCDECDNCGSFRIKK